MSYSKRQFVTGAYEELGLAASVYDMQPEDLQHALRRLDAMMAEWNGKGLRLSYPLPGSPEDSDLDVETNVPDAANETIITSLAIRLAPSFGKVVTQETKMIARKGYNTILVKSVQPPEMQFRDTLPVGAGNKEYGYNNRRFFPTNRDSLDVGPDSNLEFN